MTKQAKRYAREREQEKVVVVRTVFRYRTKRWLNRFATGIRFMELAWAGRQRYFRPGRGKQGALD